jgi:ribose-phosphate pyrophosphokinase
MNINLNTGQNIKTILYPDNQPHVQLPINLCRYEEVDVTCSIIDSIKLLQLLELSNALDHKFCPKGILSIPYLMATRFDRVMEVGDSFDLEVIANLINSMNFERVILYDIHSDVAPALIKHSVVIDNRELVKNYYQDNAVLICPDAGAAKKVNNYFDWNKNLKDIVYCIKHRDLSNGELQLKVLEPEKCKKRNCVIIDDLCDAGGTFIAIAKKIAPSHLTLIVTHGVFSKGFSELEKHFDQIIVSDSYNKIYNSNKVTTIKFNY